MNPTARKPLRSEQHTDAMRRRVRRACNALGYRGDVVFEHGHWWLLLEDGSTFDVVDAGGHGTNIVDGFALERVS